jgi:hypothetical protein
MAIENEDWRVIGVSWRPEMHETELLGSALVVSRLSTASITIWTVSSHVTILYYSIIRDPVAGFGAGCGMT